MKSRNSKSTFRFPFDIHPGVFIGLAVITFIFSFDGVRALFTPSKSVNSYRRKIEADLERRFVAFEKLIADTALLNRLAGDRVNPEDLSLLQQQSFHLFLHRDDSLLFWSTNDILPDLPVTEKAIPLESRRGYYTAFAKAIPESNGKLWATAVATVKNENPFNSSNFQTNFPAGDAENEFGLKLSAHPSEGAVPIKVRGETVYWLYRSEDFFSINDRSGWRLFFNALPFIFFGISIHTYFKVMVKKRPPALIYSVLLLTALSIRLLNYYLNIPTDFSQYALFDSKYFATDFFNRSLGDTFVNMCLTFWFLLFFAVNVQGKVFDMIRQPLWMRMLFISLVFAGMLSGATHLANLIYEIIQDSVINFDTTVFSRIDLFSFIGLLTFMVIFANLLLGVIITNTYFNSCLPWKYAKYAALVLGYIAFVLLYKAPYPIRYEFGFLAMALVMFLLDKPAFRFRFDFNSYILLSWIIVVSVAGAGVLAYFITEKEKVSRADYATRLLKEGDRQVEERILAFAEQIHNDPRLTSWMRQTGQHNEEDISQHIRISYIGNNFTRYKTELHYFNHKGENLNAQDNVSMEEPVSGANNEEEVASSPFADVNVFHAANEKGYEVRIPVGEDTTRLGTLVFILRKPILLQKEDYTGFIYQDESMRRAREYNYSTAIYDKGRIEMQKGSYEFREQIDPAEIGGPGQHVIRDKKGFTELWFHDDVTHKIILVAKQTNMGYLFTTLFAYMFLVYFVVISLYILGNISARSNLNYRRFLNLLSLNLRLRIHGAIIIVILVSFIAVGLYTSNYFITRLVEQNRSEISSYSQALRRDLTQYLGLRTLSKPEEVDSLVRQPSAQRLLKEFADKFRININLFDIRSGRLLYSTEPGIFDNGLLTPRINPQAFRTMRSGNLSHYINSEYIGTLDYMASYSYLRNARRENMVLMQLPYISSNVEINSETTTLIVTLINLFVLVFLFSSILALLITNSVTRPFTYIVKQFTKINLTKTNEPLRWDYSDEIGLLVKEYNRMLRKLENSTVLLAKSEREMAWREMAKQVAHEIKNPLTPMKLSLQMLERAIKNKNPNVPEITARVTGTLIEQIDNLTLIATNFSNFAKMPEMKREYFVLNDVLYAVTGMYNDDKQHEYLFLIPDFSIHVFADKSQLIRVFTNIIQNAIQSIPEERKGNISLLVSKVKNNFVRVSITDNGVGIPKEMSDKLFQPYFTTKSSGTGLGLAMCKDIIESFGGRIWFESAVGEGTTFHIDLPLTDIEEHA